MAAAQQLLDNFRTSYQDFQSYPRNLTYQTSYPAAVLAYRTRLDTGSTRLFTSINDEDVPFRDYNSTTHAFERQNVRSDAALEQRLIDQSTIDPLNATVVGNLASKQDPKCRFVFMWAGHSRRPLRITKKMFLRIMTYHQVMTGYLDFISVFGTSNETGESRELRFSGFREQTTLSIPARGPAVHELGRSGRQFQLCYNLKGVACISPPTQSMKQKVWSIRQAAFHHQFDVEIGTTLWIMTKGDLELKERIQNMTGKDGRPEDKTFGTPAECFKSSLAVHLLQCHWSTEEWRWYIQWLEDVTEVETHLAIEAPRDPDKPHIVYTTDNLQIIQRYEDKTNEAIMILETNVDVLTSLRQFYERLIDNQDFDLRQSCREHVLSFSTQINDLIYDCKNQIARAKVLVRITADRKAMVLQHLQSQATLKMEVLTVSMHKIGTLAQKEAIAMRIITVVTLIYLPATFVSTFFSTDVVKYQNPGGSDNSTDTSGASPGPYLGSFSEIALIRWIEVTVPLTFFTLVLGWFFFKLSDRKRRRAGYLPFSDMDSKASLP